MKPDFTILGAGGRIGHALVAALRQRHVVQAVGRAELPGFLANPRPAGHVINAIGLTGDFRSRPLDTQDAHVGVVARCLARGALDSFLLLSSTRVYGRAAATHEEAPLPCCPSDPSDLYNLTKLAGEALCLSDPRPTVRVARLSNVFDAMPDPDTFLGQIMQEGQAHGRVTFRQAPDSAKDYIRLDHVVSLLPRIAAAGRHRLYNVAAGRNVSHAEIAALLRECRGWHTDFAPDAATVGFPRIEIGRVRTEFAAPLSDPLRDLSTLAAGQEAACLPSTRPAVA